MNGPSHLQPGERFERYTIEALIGRGGMGEVYRAVDTRLRRKVAIKVVRPERAVARGGRPEDAVARLHREARAAAALSHPNAVAVYDVGEVDGVFYIVMELVSGQPLLAYVGDPRPPLARKLGWLKEVARALASAHRAGVLHRDVKPANIMISDEGFAKVLDFGLARPIERDADPTSFRTEEGRVLGTLRYMAPEQIAGAEADARTDQYSFGVTAYELLAGAHPGGAMEPGEPKLLSYVVPSVPRAAAEVIARAMARNPDARYPTMDDVADALEAASPAPTTMPEAHDATPPTLVAPTVPRVVTPAREISTFADRRAAHARAHDVARTLLSREAPSAILALREQRQAAPRTPVSAPPPAEIVQTLASAPGLSVASVKRAAAPSSVPTPPAPSRTGHVGTVIVTVLVLAAAAFAGTYLGSRARSPSEAPSQASTSHGSPR